MEHLIVIFRLSKTGCVQLPNFLLASSTLTTDFESLSLLLFKEVYGGKRNHDFYSKNDLWKKILANKILPLKPKTLHRRLLFYPPQVAIPYIHYRLARHFFAQRFAHYQCKYFLTLASKTQLGELLTF